MRAAVYYSNSDIRLEERPVPHIGPGELLMRVEASGICGSDVMEWYRIQKAPLVLGHEVAGEVVEVGKDVQTFEEGDRIVVDHHVPCNTCSYCLSGHHTACDTLRRTNFDPGGFAEYIRLPAINVDRGTFRIPEGMSLEEATFHEPLGCIIRALRVARFDPGQTLLVLGSGMAGLLGIHLARAYGAGRILAVDIIPYRLDMAVRFGADVALQPEEDIPGRLREMSGGRLADLVFVSTGATAAQTQALNCVERGGTVLFFAPTAPGVEIPVSINDLFFRNDITLATSYGAAPLDSFRALELIQTPAVHVKNMITHRLPLAETEKGFELVARAQESMKVIVNPQK